MLSVLIAEDNVILADMLEEFLIFGGYDICGSARTVDEAVKLADLHKPDLAVFDYRLAGGEYGSQICPRLKNDVGILYASGDPLDMTLTAADGEAYIQKPYAMKDLLLSLEIIQEIRTKKNVFRTSFPQSFHLLEAPRDSYRTSV